MSAPTSLAFGSSFRARGRPRLALRSARSLDVDPPLAVEPTSLRAAYTKTRLAQSGQALVTIQPFGDERQKFGQT